MKLQTLFTTAQKLRYCGNEVGSDDTTSFDVISAFISAVSQLLNSPNNKN